MSEELPKRIPFVVAARSDNNLQAGIADVTRVHHIFTNPKFGDCDNRITSLQQCDGEQDFRNKFYDIIEDWDSNNQLIFYFSGHGHKLKSGYHLQVGIDRKRRNLISFQHILDDLDNYDVQRAIIIIDACYSGNITAKGSTGTDCDEKEQEKSQDFIEDINLQKIPKGIAIIASSGKTQLSYELEDNSYSVFTELLCQGIETGLDNNPTDNGLISINDIVGYINKKLTKDPKYIDYHQKARLKINDGEPDIWIATNISDANNASDFNTSKKNNLKNTATTINITPDFNLVKYQETILEKYGNLKLESLDSSGYIYDKELKIYQIFIPQNVKECQEYLPQVYELPKDLQRKLKEEGELEREITQEELERYKRAYTDQQIRSVLDVIADDKYKCLVILGDPGSGKSTLLQYLAVEWAKLPTKELPSHAITLLIELRAYIQDFAEKRCDNFLEFIHKGSGWIGHLNQNELDQRLKQGEVRVLFDGLDEVFEPQQRANVITQIHSFTQTYDKVKVIVTSRVIGYKPQQLKDAEFHHFMLQDLEPEQIEDFLQKWHDLTYNKATESQKKQDRQQRITKAIKESQAIQQLAVNPLLLTMMAILNRNQDLPRDRAKLYERSSELLLYQWDVERLLEDPELKGVDIDYQDKQAMLRDVAYFMQATEKGLAGNLISQKDLEKILIDYLKTIDVNPARKVARLMIEQLRTRNFILCDIGSNYYAFVHRTFLEYFCAWSFIWQFKETQILSIDEMKTKVYGKHWQDESWNEVLLLISGMLDPNFVGDIIEYLMTQDGESANFANLFLASDCLEEVRNRKSITLVANRLLEKLKQLAKTTAFETDDLHILFKLFFDEYKTKIPEKVINSITKNWKDETSTLSWLQTCLKLNSYSSFPRFALIAIVRGWKDHPETLPILQQLAQSDDVITIRITALSELARGWQDDPKTLPILQQLAQSDDTSTIRITALSELARGWQDHPETLPILQQLAQSDNDNDVRSTAIHQLAKGWKDHPETKAILLDRSKNDHDEENRELAQQELDKLS